MNFTVVQRAILLTDIVGSTFQTAAVGDLTYTTAMATFERNVRELVRRHDGREIDKSDGFLIAFEQPLNALLFALELIESLEALASAIGFPVRLRTGLHFGSLIQRNNSPEDIAVGAKAMELDGLTKIIAARLMELAEPNQILVTKAIFDMMRENEQLVHKLGGDTLWLAHGNYLLYGLTDPLEIFEAGRKPHAPLVAPIDKNKARRAILPQDEVTLGWRPAIGQMIPTAERWKVVRKLGEGGYGEVWLAQRSDTRDLRVFKFCFDATRIRGLIREKKLLDIIQEKLGNRPDIVHILDWNINEAPYFIALDYIPCDNLPTWLDKRQVVRLSEDSILTIIRKTATAIEAAHSVGILHKDIKPSNLLVGGNIDDPEVHLIDFGIGLHITDLGVAEEQDEIIPAKTQTTLRTSSLSGSRMYVAPEVLEGNSPTRQADIYPLGILLYQLIRGDLATGIKVGWERDITDPFMVQLIADMIDGNLDRRLKSAAELVAHVESLEARRKEAARLKQEEQRLQQLEISRQTWRRVISAGAIGTVIIVCLTGMWDMQKRRVSIDSQLAEKIKADRQQNARLSEFRRYIAEKVLPDFEHRGRVTMIDRVTSEILSNLSGQSTGISIPPDSVNRLVNANLLLQHADANMALYQFDEALKSYSDVERLLPADYEKGSTVSLYLARAESGASLCRLLNMEVASNTWDNRIALADGWRSYLRNNYGTPQDALRALQSGIDAAIGWPGKDGIQMMQDYSEATSASLAQWDNRAEKQFIEAVAQHFVNRVTLPATPTSIIPATDIPMMRDAVKHLPYDYEKSAQLLDACLYYANENLTRALPVSLACLATASGVIDTVEADPANRDWHRMVAKYHAIYAKALSGTGDYSAAHIHAEACDAVLAPMIIEFARDVRIRFDYWETRLENQIALGMIDEQAGIVPALERTVETIRACLDRHPRFYFYMKNLLFTALELSMVQHKPEPLYDQLAFVEILYKNNAQPGQTVTPDIIKSYKAIAAEPRVFENITPVWLPEPPSARQTSGTYPLAIRNQTREVYTFRLYAKDSTRPFLNRIIMSNRESDFTHTVMNFCSTDFGISINNSVIVPLYLAGSYDKETNRFEINMTTWLSKYASLMQYRLPFPVTQD